MDDGVQILGSETGSDQPPADASVREEPEMVRQQGREELRGELFTALDRLAFALELEAAEAVESGDEERALRLEDQRLGVRLSQRLVSGVHAHEVQPRLTRSARAYDERMR